MLIPLKILYTGKQQGGETKLLEKHTVAGALWWRDGGGATSKEGGAQFRKTKKRKYKIYRKLGEGSNSMEVFCFFRLQHCPDDELYKDKNNNNKKEARALACVLEIFTFRSFNG